MNAATPRVIARQSGATKYRGKPCKYGHSGERYTRSAQCVGCQLLKSKTRRHANPAYFAAASAKWRHAHPQQALLSGRNSHKKNRAHRIAFSSRYKKLNRARLTALQMKRHAGKLKRTPPWANTQAIDHFYREARRLTLETGIRHVVDHIIPLQGRTVSGLHVEQNLQVLTFSANASKWNRYSENNASL